MVDIKKRLEQKGWSEQEIEKTMQIIADLGKESPHSINLKKNSNPIIYWTALIITLIGNFLISVVLIPFLLVLSGYVLYIIIMLIAFVFGFLFYVLLADIEHVDAQHHVIAGAFIPAVAVITVFVMVNISNNLGAEINSVAQNPLYVSIAYVVAFVLPYLFSVITGSTKKQNLLA